MTDLPNLVWHDGIVTRATRERQNDHKSYVVWFTGLPGAGKSTLAYAVEYELQQRGARTYVLDGDNIRHGINRDLGFDIDDRHENIRRVGELCRLFVDAGVITMVALISPYREDRARVRSMLGSGDFVEVYCSADVPICETRDVKGHYQRARAGQIPHFTGVTAPYEVPENHELTVDTGHLSLDESVALVLTALDGRKSRV